MSIMNRNYKDRLFCRLFGDDKEALLSLYNALNHTSYTDSSELEINTIDDVLYMGMKNDVSCIVDNDMMIAEQQSTYNPNMPIRSLLYYARLVEKYEAACDLNIYRTKQVMIPRPRCFCLYNGTANRPDKEILKLSDAFVPADGDGCEWTVTMLNINYGRNEKLLSACKMLHDYSYFVQTSRKYGTMYNNREEAITKAVDECIEKGILRDFLLRHKAEVIGMMLTEFDEERYLADLKQDSKDEGFEEGRAEGRVEGRAEGRAEGITEGRVKGITEAGKVYQMIYVQGLQTVADLVANGVSEDVAKTALAAISN